MTTENKNISALKKKFSTLLADRFDKKKFDEDFRAGKEISVDNIDSYMIAEVSKDKKNTQNNIKSDTQEHEETQIPQQQSSSFKTFSKNGKHYAVGSNGERLEAKNKDALEKQIAQSFKNSGMDINKESIRFHSYAKDPKEFKKDTECFARNFIMEGVPISGDIPQDPKFWKKLQKDFLKNKDNNLDKWNNLTRNIPPEYMGKNQEMHKNHSQEKSAQTKAKFINSLRNGKNPNLTPQQTPKSSQRIPNNLQIKQALLQKKALDR